MFAAPRGLSQLTASFVALRCQAKPRARFDCLEIELLMSSHSNFSRLPLSKIAEIDPRNRFFFSRMVAWSFGRMVRPSDHSTVGPKLVGVTGVEPVTFTLSV